MRSSWRLIVTLLAGIFAAGCAREPLPQLLTVRDVTPREIELGDRLEIAGAGYAQGRPAHVHLHGTAERPGEEPEAIDVELDGDVITPERIEVAVSNEAIGKLCGTGVHATHTTFEGSVEVLFAATQEGAPPVTGVASHVTLDAYPPDVPRAQLEARADEGTRFLKTAGLHLRGEADGFVVGAVEPGSPADRAGIMSDDVIVAASGLRVASLGDFAPPPAALSIPLSVRRGTSEVEQAHVIALEASAAPLSSRLLVPALLVALALALVLFGASAPGRLVPWLRRRLHDGPPGRLVHELFPSASPIGRYVVPTVALAATVAAPLAASADVAALAFAIVFGRVAVALTLGRAHAGASPLRRALAAFAEGLPLVVVTLGVVFTLGARSAGEISQAATAPLGCPAFRSPLHLALAALALGAGIVPAIGDSSSHLEDPSLVRRGGFASIGEWLAAWAQVSLVVVLFFGGFHAGGAPVALGGALFALKTAALFAVAVALRAALARRASPAAVKSALAFGVPGALALTVLARLWESHVGAKVVQMGASVATIVTVIALAVALVRKPAVGRRIGLDPFR